MGADEGSVVTEDEDTPIKRQRFVRVGLVGTSSADRIRASGHARRIKQAGHMAAPDRDDIRPAFTSCEVGAVHTWLFSTHADLAEDLESAQDSHALRRILQLRAEIGWLMRGHPNRGMRPSRPSLSGHRAPAFRPAQPARAPPSPPRVPTHPESVAKTPPPAAMTRARIPAPPELNCHEIVMMPARV